jgi:proteasome lid subunit RPN8/RPN11
MPVYLPSQMVEAMLVHARNCHPEEACGLLAMDPEGRVRMAYPLTNAQHSEFAYTVEPGEHFGAIRHAEARGWEIGGAFHSHPHSEAYPSATDIELAVSPHWLYVLVGMNGSHREIRGFRIDGEAVHEEHLLIARPQEER